MKRNFWKLLPVSLLCALFLTGCCISHDWKPATCAIPQTCSKCGKTKGQPTEEHTWSNATCIEPKTCSVCLKKEGDALGHTWIDATCTEPKTCSVCGYQEGEALGHAEGGWEEEKKATKKTLGKEVKKCSSCGEILDSKDIYYYEISQEEEECYDMALNIFNSLKEANQYGDTIELLGAKKCEPTALSPRVTVAISLLNVHNQKQIYYFWQTFKDTTKISNNSGKEFYVEGLTSVSLAGNVSKSNFKMTELDMDELRYYEKVAYSPKLISAENIKIDTEYIYDVYEDKLADSIQYEDFYLTIIEQDGSETIVDVYEENLAYSSMFALYTDYSVEEEFADAYTARGITNGASIEDVEAAYGKAKLQKIDYSTNFCYQLAEVELPSLASYMKGTCYYYVKYYNEEYQTSLNFAFNSNKQVSMLVYNYEGAGEVAFP